jgi:hypothetical protein
MNCINDGIFPPVPTLIWIKFVATRMREVHWPAGNFNHLGEFPAEQPNDLPLSSATEAFYRSGPTFWQRYTSFWMENLICGGGAEALSN